VNVPAPEKEFGYGYGLGHVHEKEFGHVYENLAQNETIISLGLQSPSPLRPDFRG
jgi:hypothetical protein